MINESYWLLLVLKEEQLLNGDKQSKKESNKGSLRLICRLN